MEIHTHVLFLEEEKGGGLLKDQGPMDSFMDKNNDDPSAPPCPSVPPKNVARRRIGSEGVTEEASREGAIEGGNLEPPVPEMEPPMPEDRVVNFEENLNSTNNNETQPEAVEDNGGSSEEDTPEPVVKPPKEQASNRVTTRYGREVIPTRRFDNEARFANMAIQEQIQEPATYKEALRSPGH